MPIEIQELEINTQIINDQQENIPLDEESRESIIAECIERILQLMNDKNEL